VQISTRTRQDSRRILNSSTGLRDKPLDFSPGKKWAYSNTGYILLGRIIEVVSHRTYREYLQSRIFDRLGMTQTYTVANESDLHGMAVGYRHVDRKMQRAPTIHDSFGWAAGHIVSTIRDLNKWKQALRSGNVVTQAHYGLMATSVRTRESDAGYGLGLFVDQVEGETRVGHTGGTFGFTSAEKYFPKHRVQLIAFTNSGDDAPEPGEVLTQAIYDDLYPDIAAAAALPSGAVEARTLSTAKEIFASLQSGTYDYSHFSDGIGAKLKSGFAAGWMKSFSGYGSPTRFVFKGSRVSPGRRWSDYLIKFGPGCYLKFGFAVDDDGKVASLSLG